MSGEHTPGPWKSQNIKHIRDTLPREIVGPDGEDLVADIVYLPADARLIAAAPEMLAALVWAMDKVPKPSRRIKGQNDEYCDSFENARAIIAKAKGEG